MMANGITGDVSTVMRSAQDVQGAVSGAMPGGGCSAIVPRF